MGTREKRAKLIREINGWAKSLRNSNTPKKKITLLERAAATQRGHTFSTKRLIEDFHARIPEYLREIRKGNSLEAYQKNGELIGLYAGIREKMDTVVEYPSNDKPPKRLHS